MDRAAPLAPPPSFPSNSGKPRTLLEVLGSSKSSVQQNLIVAGQEAGVIQPSRFPGKFVILPGANALRAVSFQPSSTVVRPAAPQAPQFSSAAPQLQLSKPAPSTIAPRPLGQASGSTVPRPAFLTAKKVTLQPSTSTLTSRLNETSLEETKVSSPASFEISEPNDAGIELFGMDSSPGSDPGSGSNDRLKNELERAKCRVEAEIAQNESQRDDDATFNDLEESEVTKENPSVRKVLMKIRLEQERQRHHLEKIDFKLQKLLDLQAHTSLAAKPAGWPSKFPLPAKQQSKDKFFEWEYFLSKKANFDFAVGHFSVVAGRGNSEGEMATNICKLLFSPPLAAMINWVGTEKKLGIKDLKTGALIVEACARQYEGNFQKTNITGSISKWLRSFSAKGSAPT